MGRLKSCTNPNNGKLKSKIIISYAQKAFITDLPSDTNIIIKEADKGGVVVTMDKLR